MTDKAITSRARSHERLAGKPALARRETRLSAPRTSIACAGRCMIEHTLACRGAEKLWRLLHERPFVNTLGALTGNQAMQQVKAGLEAIYLSGWQVAADANDSCQMYPDQSLYAVSSVPTVVRRINNALMRADQIHHAEGETTRHRLVRAHRRGRRAGIRRRAERLRAHEGDDRGGRGRRALRGPVVVGEEVRAHGRQGARSHAGSGAEARSPPGSPRMCSACRRCCSRARTRKRPTLVTSDVDENDKPFLTGERTLGRLLSREKRHRAGDLERPRLRAVRRSRVVRDRHAGPRLRAALRRSDPQRKYPGQAARLQLLALVQLEAQSR